MRAVTGFMVHVELAIVEVACGVVIIRCSVILQLVKAVDVLQSQSIRNVPRCCCLRGARVECFMIQTVGSRTDVTAADISGEYAFIIRSKACVRGLIPTVQ